MFANFYSLLKLSTGLANAAFIDPPPYSYVTIEQQQ
jgi:hypothetical protein